MRNLFDSPWAQRKADLMHDPEVARILRVDHAGEKGAIQIYRAQKLVATYLYPELVETLDEMLQHEQTHFAVFDRILRDRGIRSCYSLFLWSTGGWILGFVTGLLGRTAIGTTTDAVESTVLDHLTWQLDYLAEHDPEVWAAVEGIRKNEIEHREWGEGLGSRSAPYAPIRWIVSGTTSFAIWLSTRL